MLNKILTLAAILLITSPVTLLNANQDIIQYGYNYTGDLNNGVRDGKGKYIYSNGDTYDGEWKNDLKEGEGTFTFHEDSHTYVGQFLNNTFFPRNIKLHRNIFL